MQSKYDAIFTHFSQLTFTFFQALPWNLNSTLCNGHGTCSNNNIGGFSCNCATGYMGTNCEIGNKKYTSFNMLGLAINCNRYLFWIFAAQLVGCFTCGVGDVVPDSCRWETMVNGLTTQMASTAGASSTYITLNNNVLVQFQTGMTIERCLKLCQLNHFVYAGLINK